MMGGFILATMFFTMAWFLIMTATSFAKENDWLLAIASYLMAIVGNGAIVLGIILAVKVAGLL